MSAAALGVDKLTLRVYMNYPATYFILFQARIGL